MTLAPETMKNGGLSELKNSSPIYIYINIANLAPLSPHIMAKKCHYYIIFAKIIQEKNQNFFYHMWLHFAIFPLKKNLVK